MYRKREIMSKRRVVQFEVGNTLRTKIKIDFLEVVTSSHFAQLRLTSSLWTPAPVSPR
jgi:hypothetical protein